MTHKRRINDDIKFLGKEFSKLNWNMTIDPSGKTHELVSQWLGRPEDEIMVCAFHGNFIDEPLHRQDFFFFNFVYVGNYEALYNQEGNRVLLNEGDLYLGQPFSGYAIKSNSEKDIAIIGVLIRTDVFYRDFLPSLSQDLSLLRFFIAPTENAQSDQMIHMSFEENSAIWKLLDLMIYEYVHNPNDSQNILKSLALTLCMYVSREHYEKSLSVETVSDKVLKRLAHYSTPPKLEVLAKDLGYHPNYLSSTIRKETGETYSKIILRWRMQRAKLLLTNTDLSVEAISSMLGYPSTSNFYKAYKSYFNEPVSR